MAQSVPKRARNLVSRQVLPHESWPKLLGVAYRVA